MAAVEDLSGRLLGGRFRLIKAFGAGGFGQVYLAEQLSMRREVAVKVIHPRLARDQTIVQRFEREARVASQLTHPNTVVYFDFGQDGDLLFLAMEYVAGRRLDHLVGKEGPLDVGRASRIARQICGSLEEAHEIALVHRDLKPSNVLITRRGGDPDFVKVIDFGLAKIISGDVDSGGVLVTAKGAMLGTPAYMSPEQIRGQPVDHRSDIYALGVLMFFMLTRRRPFVGNSPQETIHKHLHQEIPSAHQMNPEIPVGLDLLVKRCLAKDARDRPADAAEIAVELGTYLDDGRSVFSTRPQELVAKVPGEEAASESRTLSLGSTEESAGPMAPSRSACGARASIPTAGVGVTAAGRAPTLSAMRDPEVDRVQPPGTGAEREAVAKRVQPPGPGAGREAGAGGAQPPGTGAGREAGAGGAQPPGTGAEREAGAGGAQPPGTGTGRDPGSSTAPMKWRPTRRQVVLIVLACLGAVVLGGSVAGYLMQSGKKVRGASLRSSSWEVQGSERPAEEIRMTGTVGDSSRPSVVDLSELTSRHKIPNQESSTGVSGEDEGPPHASREPATLVPRDDGPPEGSSNLAADVVSSLEEPNAPARQPHADVDRDAEAVADPASGRVRVFAVPWGDVFCNRDPLGRTPVDQRLGAGHYECSVRGPRGQIIPARFELDPGETEVIRVNFNQ